MRLGSGKRGDDDVIKHGFLKSSSLAELHQRGITAPWVPKLRSARDLSHFEATEDDLENEDLEEYEELMQTEKYKRELTRLEAAFKEM